MEISKKMRQRLRELAGIAYERDLRKSLKPIEQALADMHAGKCDAVAVSEIIHQFHQNSARELWIQYQHMEPEFSIAMALNDNLISPEELPEAVRQQFIERVKLLRVLRHADVDESKATKDAEETMNEGQS